MEIDGKQRLQRISDPKASTADSPILFTLLRGHKIKAEMSAWLRSLNLFYFGVHSFYCLSLVLLPMLFLLHLLGELVITVGTLLNCNLIPAAWILVPLRTQCINLEKFLFFNPHNFLTIRIMNYINSNVIESNLSKIRRQQDIDEEITIYPSHLQDLFCDGFYLDLEYLCHKGDWPPSIGCEIWLNELSDLLLLFR